MANLEETASWESVYQIERTDPVLGGVDGVANKPLKNLTNRTAYLKAQVESITSMLDLLFPVGHMLITRNPNNPNSYGYPGEWQRETNDFSLISTTNNSYLGQISGDNNPSVPLPNHSHTASSSSFDYGVKRSNTTGNHSHSGTANTSGAHNHDLPVGSHTGPGSSVLNCQNNSVSTGHIRSSGAHSHSLSINSSGNHYHDINVGAHSHSITVNGTGTAGAKLDVRGKCMKVAIWTRIS